MNIIVGELRRRRVVKKMDGSIIDWSDDTPGGGGVIIKKGEVVNEKKIVEFNKKEEDKQLAGKAESLQKVETNIPDRNINPTEQGSLKERVDAMEGDIKQILKILTDKK